MIATTMTPKIAPMITATERSFKWSDGAPFHTTIIYNESHPMEQIL